MSLPAVDDADVLAVVEVLRSGRLALGPAAVSFERDMAERIGVRNAIAVSSGTAALHLIVRGLGLGPGDEVLVPSFTFAASVNALLYEGVRPVFVDVEPDTFNLSVADCARRVTDRTRAVMVVDVFGHPAEWDEIEAFAHDHDVVVIDDACEALGSSYRGRPAGSFGRASALAFYPNKQITTGEGGMILTDDDGLAALATSLRNQGRGEMGAWLEHERLGFNYRMDEMSAALGRSQLRRLDALVEGRTRVAAQYGRRLADLPWLRTPVVRPHVQSSWFVYVVLLDRGVDRQHVVRELESCGVPARGYFPPMHLQPYVRRQFAVREGALPVTEDIAARTLALPFHANLSTGEIDRVVDALAASVGSVAHR
jgi:perosamine synthetase